MSRQRRTACPGYPGGPGGAVFASRQRGTSCRTINSGPTAATDMNPQRPILRLEVHRPGDQADRRRLLRLSVADAARPLFHHDHLGRHPRRGALSGLRRIAEASRWPRRAGGDPDHAVGPRDHRRPARGGHGQRRRNHAGAGRRLREPDGGRAAASGVGAGVAGDRRKGPCGVEPRLQQSRSRGEAVRTSAAASGRRDRRQDRGRRLRHARIRRIGAGRRLSFRPGPAAGRSRQDLRPPHRGRSRGALRRSGRSDDPQHLARGDRRRSCFRRFSSVSS